MSRIFIRDYEGYKIQYNDECKKYLVDTGKAIYFRDTLNEIMFLIDNLNGYMLEKEHF